MKRGRRWIYFNSLSLSLPKKLLRFFWLSAPLALGAASSVLVLSDVPFMRSMKEVRFWVVLLEASGRDPTGLDEEDSAGAAEVSALDSAGTLVLLMSTLR